ncbi:MAG: hypothetical protein AAGA85_10225 [Bacteroidota bacterium]
MKLIGEAGGTKIDWRLLRGDEVKAVRTSGFNATLSSELAFVEELTAHIVEPIEVDSVHFYAAGIRGPERALALESLFRRCFPNAQMEVASDTLAAARGLLGLSSGWVGFLGTGAGLARYDGNGITWQVPSLGYVLGDEGSAAYLGKQLIRHYLRGTLGDTLRDRLQELLASTEDVLDQIYMQPQPQRFLGSLAAILEPDSRDREIRAIIDAGFQAYFDAFLPHHEGDTTVSFTGNVAYLHQNQLLEVARRRNLSVGDVVKSPVDGLVRFHTTQSTTPSPLG